MQTSARRALVAGATALAFLSAGAVPVLSDDPDGVSAQALTPIEQQAPTEHGDAPVDGLQYADPTEGLGLIDPPEPNADGTVSTSFPIDVPPGHGITPELAVGYDSSGDNSWMGLGWDLGVGEIAVDTTFGAPHFDPAFESESYTHDGELLVPNANDDAWEPRTTATRRDFTHRVETEFSEIIRHVVGDGGPDDYFWEVRGKDGGVRWYGATPDSGGPVPSTTSSVPTIDENAVVRDEEGNIVRWLLSAERDIGVNLIRYEYDTVVTTFSDGNWIEVTSCDSGTAVCGRHAYLDRILYTDATSAITGFNGPPYEIDFIRESELGTPGTVVRDDPIVNARLGYVDVTADRLARIDIKWGAPPATGSARTYTDLAGRYDFDYQTGWFGKSLLTTITQGVTDLHVHRIDYFNELGTPNADTTGWNAATDWTTVDEANAVDIDAVTDLSLLGGAVNNAGSGNIYIGFNPFTPSKTGSFGLGLELSGSDTDSIAEWIDLNGDSLPDKVFLDGSTVRFRLNTSGPSGTPGFTSGDARAASGLTGLSEDSDFAFQISAEAYPIVALGVGTGLSFSWSNHYFADVNADGLVDFVNGGQVLFNRLVGGVPTFSSSSDQTLVPLDPASLPAISLAGLEEIDAAYATQSPPIDTLRRWTAPFAGTVRIVAPVALDAAGLSTTDGVRVAIEKNGADVVPPVVLDNDASTPQATSAFPDPIDVGVAPGDRIYFRTGAVEDGVNDSVDWSPVITYQSVTWGVDANGLSQTTYDAAADFTLAGRPDDAIGMPWSGTAAIVGTVDLAGALTDDVTVTVVRHVASLSGDEIVTSPTVVATTTIAAGTTGSTPVSASVPVSVTQQSTGNDEDGDGVVDTVAVADRLEVYLAADSPVDLGLIAWGATITVPNPTPGEPAFVQHLRPHVDVYPGIDPATPSVATSLPDTFTAVLEIDALGSDAGTAEAVITFKNGNGTVKRTVTVGDRGAVEFDVDLTSINDPADPYFVDVSVRDSWYSRDGLDLLRLARYTSADKSTSTAIDGRLRWTGLQGVFPNAYRGWAVAGYTAAPDLDTAPIDETAFDIEYDENATVQEPTRDDIGLDTSSAESAYAFVPGALAPDENTSGSAVPPDRWIGPRDAMWVTGAGQRTSRLIEDFGSITALATGGGSGQRSGPTRLGIGGPGLTLMFGVGPLGASAGLSPSFGITDFEDLNGDGYPDVVSAGSVTYTDQRGGYLSSRSVDGTSVTNQDLTFSVSGGLSSGMVDIVPSPKGSTNATQGNAAAKGQNASDEGPAYSLGVTGGGGFSWSSPNASGGDAGPSGSSAGDQYSSLVADSDDDSGGVIQRAFADVNGDGLADQVYTNAQGTFAYYGLGYGFTEKAVKLGTGGFESRESASGGFGLGFSLPYGEFGGGINTVWNSDWSRYGWLDLNGDGILDQFHRIGENDVKVRFGTGSGLLGEIDYGSLVDVSLTDVITSNQHFSLDVASGIGGGVSATAYIGPLCLVACYLVIGGGAGYNYSMSTSVATVEDIDGDGFADVLHSTDDDSISVGLNKQGKTNLLRSVANPLGGSFTVDYVRDGNTTDHPDSVWTMSQVVIDDGRADGDAADTAGDSDDEYTRTFDYEGLRYDTVHRESLGYHTVTITERDDAGTPLRVTTNEYLNDNIFVKGLVTDVTTFEADGVTPIIGSSVTWGFDDVRIPDGDPHDAITPTPTVTGETTSVASRGRSIAPVVTARSDYWYDSPGVRTFERRFAYVYDGLGNVLTETDQGADLDGNGTFDDDGDELVTTLVYSACDQPGATGNGCLDVVVTAAGDVPSPLQSAGTCVNWASYPGSITVREGTEIVRQRTGMAALCDNGAVTEERILVSSVPDVWAVTNMTVNQYGDYELIMGPPGEDGDRYTVRYTYDADRHTDITRVEEFDVAEGDAAAALAGGIDPVRDQVGISSRASIDPLSGRVASRTDANGATRFYTYDELGRNTEISQMMTGGAAPVPLITIEYHANATGYAHAIARHVDAFDGNDPAGTDDATGGDTTATIDTITFVDGLGRVTQTKRDARMVPPGGSAPRNGRQVTGTVRYDQLARPIVEFGPVVDDGPATSFTAAAFGGKQTETAYDTVDYVSQVTEPGGRVTTYEYPFEQLGVADPDPLLTLVVETDPEGRQITVAEDIRGFQRVHIETPPAGSPLPELRTDFDVDLVGQTTAVTDSADAVTTYAFDLRGDPVSIVTPNSGETAFAWDLAGRQSRKVNEMMRAAGTEIAYGYDLGRLVRIDNPGVVDDVTYDYGLDNADGRFTAGRVRRIDDRTRIADNSYGATGALVAQRVEVKRHNWDPALSEAELEEFRWTTQWTYDGLGRIATIRYPDVKSVQRVPLGTSVADLTDPSQLAALLESVDLPGELVTYDYDSGGLVREISGVEEGIVVGGEPIDQYIDGVQTTVQVPRAVDHDYEYLLDRQYDHRLFAVRDDLGNSAVTLRAYDPDTAWLTDIVTTSADPDPAVLERIEIQDIAYTYDIVGRVLTYENDLPYANRAINGGTVTASHEYDGYGRVVGSQGTFSLKADTEQRYRYGVEFTPSAPWNLVGKTQTDEYATLKPDGSDKKVWPTDATTYSVDRTLGTVDGPLHVLQDERTDADGVTQVYEYEYNLNGAIETMLADQATSIPTTGKGGKKVQPAEPNEWDRTFRWNSLDQLTSADDGSELRIFAYDDTGKLTIQDGNLLADDGTQLRQSGAGPETIFLNQWVTIRAQKIYKHVWAGDDPIVTKMDADASFESKQLYRHTDLVGSTNIITDDQGRGFQRHEYLPSGEIWIDDRKEEIRTPFQFAGGYYEDLFDLVLFGPRWYDTERELFLSPDPILVEDVSALIDQPALGGAYTYARANGTSVVDPSGRRFFGAHQKLEVQAKIEADIARLEANANKGALSALAAKIARSKQEEAKKGKDRAELLQPNPLLKIDLAKGEVSLGAPYGPRKTWDISDKSGASTSGTSTTDGSSTKPQGATNQTGGPNAGDGGPVPGSNDASTRDAQSTSTKSTTDSTSGSDTTSTQTGKVSGPSKEDTQSGT